MPSPSFQDSKLQAARERWVRINELSIKLHTQHDLETRVEEKTRLQALIHAKEDERATVEREIVDLERKMGTATKPPCVFYSYAHRDEELRDELARHLKLLERQGAISSWHDREIAAGAELDTEISQHLLDAEIILLLVSSDFLASDYIWSKELKVALDRHSKGSARVVPIILRPCDWHSAPFHHLKALPRDGKPVSKWRSKDEAFTEIAKSLRQLAISLRVGA
jgi:hypothetical protein